jgi:hypothetical protein
MSRELLKQALDALKYHTANTYPFHLTNVAIEALKKELAKPEQEPQVCCGDYEKCWKACTPRGRWLAEQEIVKSESHIVKWSIPVDPNNFGEPLAQPEQEPVATVKFIHNKKAPDVDWHCDVSIWNGAKLYTAPPRKEWVELTEDEVQDIIDCSRGGWVDIKKAAQMLKDKNT